MRQTRQPRRDRRARCSVRLDTPDALDARRLALELAAVVDAEPVDVFAAREVLAPGERAHRLTTVRLWWWRSSWVGGVDCAVVVTDRRLLVRMPDATLGSLWWGAVVGFEADLNVGHVVLDCGDGMPRLLTGVGTTVCAVAGVAALYGIPALSEHPALAALRALPPVSPW